MDIYSMETWHLFVYCLVYLLQLYVLWWIRPYTFYLCGVWHNMKISFVMSAKKLITLAFPSGIWVSNCATTHFTTRANSESKVHLV
jgi:hypothetical protein